MDVCALVHVSDSLTRNKNGSETKRVSVVNSLRKNPRPGDTVDRISCDGDDYSALFPLSHILPQRTQPVGCSKTF